MNKDDNGSGYIEFVGGAGGPGKVSEKHMPDIVARLRTHSDFYKKRGSYLTADIQAQAADEIERLRAAISWIEPPFVDETTPEAELRKRIAFCVADARRAALAPAQEKIDD